MKINIMLRLQKGFDKYVIHCIIRLKLGHDIFFYFHSNSMIGKFSQAKIRDFLNVIEFNADFKCFVSISREQCSYRITDKVTS